MQIKFMNKKDIKQLNENKVSIFKVPRVDDNYEIILLPNINFSILQKSTAYIIDNTFLIYVKNVGLYDTPRLTIFKLEYPINNKLIQQYNYSVSCSEEFKAVNIKYSNIEHNIKLELIFSGTFDNNVIQYEGVLFKNSKYYCSGNIVNDEFTGLGNINYNDKIYNCIFSNGKTILLDNIKLDIDLNNYNDKLTKIQSNNELMYIVDRNYFTSRNSSEDIIKRLITLLKSESVLNLNLNV